MILGISGYRCSKSKSIEIVEQNDADTKEAWHPNSIEFEADLGANLGSSLGI